MIYYSNFRNQILLNPIAAGADQLKIVSGYATHTMASWHLTEIASRFQNPINLTLIVGMCQYDGLSISVHEGFKSLVADCSLPNKSRFTCQYVFEGAPVHSKLYLWQKEGAPFCAYMGSANYTQSAFSSARREIMTACDPHKAFEYFDLIERNTIYCNHAEVEDYITLKPTHPILTAEETPLLSLQGAGVSNVTVSLLSRSDDVGRRSGLNWGQRDGREPNQAYIPLPAQIARSGFFPLEKRHFSVLTDDGKQLILRIEQSNDKAVTTPLNNSLLGEYFRNRLGVSNGAFIHKHDLARYGRTDVTFYKLDDEQYFMDFSVANS
jgi:hypothetical protein